MTDLEQLPHSPQEGPEALVPLCSPSNTVELTLICSLLRSEGIFHSVFNEFFGAFKVGPSIPLYNERTVLVPASELGRARELLIPETITESASESDGFTTLEKLRMFLEVAFFGWVIPAAGRARRNGRPNQSFQADRDPRERGPRPLNSNR